MRKIVLTVALVACAALAFSSVGIAENFTVTAYVQKASGITYKIQRILADGTWVKGEQLTDLNFGTLGYDAENKILVPAHYFAIDLGVTEGGAGSPDDITFEYDSLQNPNADVGSTRGGLEKKCTVQVTKAAIGKSDDPVGPKVLLENVSSLNPISKAEFVDGWARIYVGLYDGNNDANGDGVDDFDDSGWEIFTPADEPGDYMGSLTISATVN